jgi:hypothetical protein
VSQNYEKLTEGLVSDDLDAVLSIGFISFNKSAQISSNYFLLKIYCAAHVMIFFCIFLCPLCKAAALAEAEPEPA